jgi:DNA-binding transcriptional MerR regulator
MIGLEVRFKSMGNLLDIGTVADQTGVAPSALRYYEREGLIRSASRNGLRRQYQATVVERLAVIVLCREAGFSLAEIKGLLATKGHSPAWKQLVERKRVEIDARIEQLTVVRTQLNHALECPSPNLMHCEHFRASTQHALNTTARRSNNPK